MLSFEFDRLLFRFRYHTPALDVLFQFADDNGAMLRRLPLLRRLTREANPAANHAANFVYQTAYCKVAMARQLLWRVVVMLPIFKLKIP